VIEEKAGGPKSEPNYAVPELEFEVSLSWSIRWQMTLTTTIHLHCTLREYNMCTGTRYFSTYIWLQTYTHTHTGTERLSSTKSQGEQSNEQSKRKQAKERFQTNQTQGRDNQNELLHTNNFLHIQTQIHKQTNKQIIDLNTQLVWVQVAQQH